MDLETIKKALFEGTNRKAAEAEHALRVGDTVTFAVNHAISRELDRIADLDSIEEILKAIDDLNG